MDNKTQYTAHEVNVEWLVNVLKVKKEIVDESVEEACHNDSKIKNFCILDTFSWIKQIVANKVIIHVHHRKINPHYQNN